MWSSSVYDLTCPIIYLFMKVMNLNYVIDTYI